MPFWSAWEPISFTTEPGLATLVKASVASTIVLIVLLSIASCLWVALGPRTFPSWIFYVGLFGGAMLVASIVMLTLACVKGKQLKARREKKTKWRGRKGDQGGKGKGEGGKREGEGDGGEGDVKEDEAGEKGEHKEALMSTSRKEAARSPLQPHREPQDEVPPDVYI